jgi:hypothetical protein
VGLCKAGSQLCQNGGWGACSGEITPADEQCDAADNDCNGQIDDGSPGGGQPCDTGLPGMCNLGETTCDSGDFLCVPVVMAEPETCDGIDNDCNGAIDDGVTGNEDCSTGQPGVCQAGKVNCVNGAPLCVQVVMPSPETCDALDNNCNGAVDEGNPGGGTPCDTGLAGACKSGFATCDGGMFKCTSIQPPVNEICDGVDNDCDGTVDDVAGVGTLCNTGNPAPCNMGTLQCQGAALVCKGAANGQVDEGNPGGGAACMTGQPGVCGPGTTTCQSGALACVANASMGPELCLVAGDENCNGSSATVYFYETFGNNVFGWTFDTEWSIGAATASTGQNYGNPDPATDHSASADNGVAGVVIGGNASTMQHGYRWITSPNIYVDAAAPTVYLQLWRWLNSDFAPWMTNRIEVFDATANAWSLVWQSGNSPGVTDTTWTKQVYDITTLSKGGWIQLRFGFNVGAGGAFTTSQWNIDDVVVTTEACE